MPGICFCLSKFDLHIFCFVFDMIRDEIISTLKKIFASDQANENFQCLLVLLADVDHMIELR